jgi:hypothetical protein
MNTIEFNTKKFKIREIDLPEFGNVSISTTSLNQLLLKEDGSYTSDEAIKIDEQIFYFVEENEIELPEEKLRNLLLLEIL